MPSVRCRLVNWQNHCFTPLYVVLFPHCWMQLKFNTAYAKSAVDFGVLWIHCAYAERTQSKACLFWVCQMMFCYNLVSYRWILWKKWIKIAKSTTLRRPGLWLSFDSILLNEGMSNFIWNVVNINVELATGSGKNMYSWLTQRRGKRCQLRVLAVESLHVMNG